MVEISFLYLMKSLRYFLSTLILGCFIIPTFVSAATGSTGSVTPPGWSLTLDHFEVTLNPTTTRVGEAIDVTVRALSKGWNVVKNYRWTITITTDDYQATVPAREGYVFRPEDNGEKTFSKGLIFKKSGNFTVSAYDIDNFDRDGSVKIKVDPKAPTPDVETWAISITTPENNAVLTSSDVTVMGMTKKNSKVKIILNNVDVATVQSDNSGAYVVTLKNVLQKSSAVQAKLIDASNIAIASSSIVNFQINTAGPSFYSLLFKEGNTVEAGSTLHATVDATPWLQSVNLSIDGTVETLIANLATPGKYEKIFTAPNNPWSYPIDVTLKNVLWQTTEKQWALSLVVTARAVSPVTPLPETETGIMNTGSMSPLFQNVRVKTSGDRATFTFELLNPPLWLSHFTIRYGDSPTSLTQEVKTYTIDRIWKDGAYSWYVPGLAPKRWYFMIYATDIDGQVMDTVRTDLIPVDMLGGTCTISNVSGISVRNEKNRVMLVWSWIADATGYNVYRKSPDGTYSLLDMVTTPEYIVYVAPGAVTYADFWVKAVCGNGTTESPNYAEASHVQTGPETTFFLVFLASFIALILGKRKQLFIGR